MATLISVKLIIPKVERRGRDERLATRQARVQNGVSSILRVHMLNQEKHQGKKKYEYMMIRDVNRYYSLFYGDQKFLSTSYKKAVSLIWFIENRVYTDATMITCRMFYNNDLPNINRLWRACSKTIKLYIDYYYMMVATLGKTLHRLPSDVIIDDILSYLMVQPKEFKYLV